MTERGLINRRRSRELTQCNATAPTLDKTLESSYGAYLLLVALGVRVVEGGGRLKEKALYKPLPCLIGVDCISSPTIKPALLVNL